MYKQRTKIFHDKFQYLCETLGSHLRKQHTPMKDPISLENRVAMSLMRLGNGRGGRGGRGQNLFWDEKILMNGWDSLISLGPRYFHLARLLEVGLKKQNKVPSNIIQSMPCGIPTWFFHPKPFGWVWARNHPDVNPKRLPQATLGQLRIRDCNGPWAMVPGVNGLLFFNLNVLLVAIDLNLNIL